MSISLSLLVLIITIALLFDVVNGFHDAANSIATVVSTRVLSPLTAVVWAACFNFLAMLLFLPRVAETISKIVKIEVNDANYAYVVLCALIAAIIWDLITWWLGLPTSSSHAIIGGLAGAGYALGGAEALQWEMLATVVAFIFIAPILGFILGFILMAIAYLICYKWRPKTVYNTFGKMQLLSAAAYSIGHGANDAQKTMGIIVALLISAGIFEKDIALTLENPKTLWIIFSSHLAMAIGTALGGWRIVKTMGMKIVKLRTIGGFSAETAGASTLFFATLLGIPVSTTHTITGAIIGVGTVDTHPSKIRWGVAANVVWAWILTIPATAILGAAFFSMMQCVV